MTLVFDRWPTSRPVDGPATAVSLLVRGSTSPAASISWAGRAGLVASLSGPVLVQMDVQPQRLSPGCLLHVPPTCEVLRVESERPDREANVVAFAASAPFVEDLTAFLGIDADWTALLAGWPLPMPPDLEDLVGSAAAPSTVASEIDELMLGAVAHLLRMLRARRDAAARLVGSEVTVSDLGARLLRARVHLDARYAEPLTNRQIARVAALSEHHFLRSFKTAFGMTVGRYRQVRRLDAARRLIVDDRRRVTDVAIEVGYASMSSFSRAFRQRFGCAPSALASTFRPASFDSSAEVTESAGGEKQSGTSGQAVQAANVHPR